MIAQNVSSLLTSSQHCYAGFWDKIITINNNNNSNDANQSSYLAVNPVHSLIVNVGIEKYLFLITKPLHTPHYCYSFLNLP